MAIPVLILGESGTGKSASMRNFKPDELAIVNVVGKPLPFRGRFESLDGDSYRKIKKFIGETNKKAIVIDDAQYLMANEFMRRATERGYDKFTEIAQNFWDLINTIRALPSDVVVYVMAHTERDGSGNEKIKTIGRMLDEKITIEGMFTIVLKTAVSDGVYNFSTQNNGNDTVKSPLGLFASSLIDNDLKAVDTAIREYYELTPAAKPAAPAADEDDEDLKAALKAAIESAEQLTIDDVPAEVPEEPVPETPAEPAPVRKTRKVREGYGIKEVDPGFVPAVDAPADPAPEAPSEQPVRRRRRRTTDDETN